MRKRGEDHGEIFGQEPGIEANPAPAGSGQDLEGALVNRLRTMSWPRPTPEQRERCLQQILDRMADEKSSPRYEATRFSSEQEHRYSLTRLSSTRQRSSLPSARRQVRLATVL
ncbi:MAG: hypothetical protein QOG09_1451 [Solirubrobacterales bacterium]|jgi:hypothetical protein|nr:hypothetical protein [Solirubrobacterales bacterium]MDX6652195.1 hypothetical protein [Solirubrobacterales bacterium]MDX6663349.1 hypothetical protein [Solirubrobacterales bacterium]